MREHGSQDWAKINEIGARYGQRHHIGDTSTDDGDQRRF